MRKSRCKCYSPPRTTPRLRMFKLLRARRTCQSRMRPTQVPLAPSTCSCLWEYISVSDGDGPFNTTRRGKPSFTVGRTHLTKCRNYKRELLKRTPSSMLTPTPNSPANTASGSRLPQSLRRDAELGTFILKMNRTPLKSRSLRQPFSHSPYNRHCSMTTSFRPNSIVYETHRTCPTIVCNPTIDFRIAHSNLSFLYAPEPQNWSIRNVTLANARQERTARVARAWGIAASKHCQTTELIQATRNLGVTDKDAYILVIRPFCYSLLGGSFTYCHFPLQQLSYSPREYGTEVEPGNGSLL